ncbi:MAG: GNAT family N-acetyltransferase [Anaerolineae bacterium]|nr:GNAT family N-acetyltransferase [Anaerolineae bacterium]
MAGDISIRAATGADQPIISAMVSEARLDPTSLNWPQFMVAEQGGQVIGIGQIRPHRDGPELGSLVVLPEWRGQGIAARLIEALLARQPGVVYLECANHMAEYYTRFGFREISWRQAPLALRFKSGMANTIIRLRGIRNHRVVVMRRLHG